MGPGRWARFLVILALVVFVLLEIALRLYNPVVARVRGDEIVLPANQVYRFDHGLARRIDRFTVHTKNSLGFRGPDPPRDFANRLTVVTIGGSTTESLFISDGRTWTDALARRLERAHPDLWVNNAGIDGQTTFGHLRLLESVVARLQPRVAVFLMGAGDVCLEEASAVDTGTAPGGDWLPRAADAAAARSAAVSLVWNFFRAGRMPSRGPGPGELDLATVEELVLSDEVMARTQAQCRRTLPAYAERLRAIARVARERGMAPLWVTQPALYGEAIDPVSRRPLATLRVSARGNGRLEWRLLDAVNGVMRQVGAAEKVPVVDLARALPKSSRYFADFLHFTNDGSEEAGRLVAAGLAEVLAGLAARDSAVH